MTISKWLLLSRSGRVLQIVAADFQPGRDSDLELLRIHSDVQRLLSKGTPCSMRLFLHRMTKTAINFLSTNRAIFRETKLGPILNETDYEERELFGLIQSLKMTPSIHLKPSFQPRWTHYTSSVPYETTLLTFQITPNSLASGVVHEGER